MKLKNLTFIIIQPCKWGLLLRVDYHIVFIWVSISYCLLSRGITRHLRWLCGERISQIFPTIDRSHEFWIRHFFFFWFCKINQRLLLSVRLKRLYLFLLYLFKIYTANQSLLDLLMTSISIRSRRFIVFNGQPDLNYGGLLSFLDRGSTPLGHPNFYVFTHCWRLFIHSTTFLLNNCRILGCEGATLLSLFSLVNFRSIILTGRSDVLRYIRCRLRSTGIWAGWLPLDLLFHIFKSSFELVILCHFLILRVWRWWAIAVRIPSPIIISLTRISFNA